MCDVGCGESVVKYGEIMGSTIKRFRQGNMPIFTMLKVAESVAIKSDLGRTIFVSLREV